MHLNYGSALRHAQLTYRGACTIGCYKADGFKCDFGSIWDILYILMNNLLVRLTSQLVLQRKWELPELRIWSTIKDVGLQYSRNSLHPKFSIRLRHSLTGLNPARDSSRLMATLPMYFCCHDRAISNYLGLVHPLFRLNSIDKMLSN